MSAPAQITARRVYEAALAASIFATGLALGGALAHLYALPNKMGFDRDAYFIVQAAYRGWALLGGVLLFQLLSLFALMLAARRRADGSRLCAGAALLALIGAQAAFWIFTFPANVATENWTHVPDNWRVLRVQWEYSHAAGASLQLVALGALIIAALIHGRRRGVG